MRIYCAITRSNLELLSSQGGIESDLVSGLTIFAQTQQWIGDQDESDPEVLDDEILQQLLSVGAKPEYLLVAEIPDAQVTERNPAAGEVQVHGSIRGKDVAAYFLMDQDSELSWFGPTELAVLLDLGR